MRKKHLMGSGLAPLQAQNIAGVSSFGQTATGTTQADAFISAADVVGFTTVATGTGYRVPDNLEPGDWVVVYNGGANALNVYPPVGGSLNALATNTALSVAANKTLIIFKISETLHTTNLTA
jgi:hypothetical protein